MTEPTDTTRATRRRFLVGAAGLAATGASATRAENANNLPPNIAGWTRRLGEGVGVRAYGNPSKYEKDVIRRTVSWLTATPESSVSFTPLQDLFGIITPAGVHFERHQRVVLDPEHVLLGYRGPTHIAQELEVLEPPALLAPPDDAPPLVAPPDEVELLSVPLEPLVL